MAISGTCDAKFERVREIFEKNLFGASEARSPRERSRPECWRPTSEPKHQDNEWLTRRGGPRKR